MKRLFPTALLVLAVTLPQKAAGELEIRSSTVAIGPNARLTFQFDASSGENGFEIQSATTWQDPWQVVPQAAISELMPGLYQVAVPIAPTPASFYRISTSGAPLPALFINEAMSDNTGTMSDSSGQFWDWIELFNAEDIVIDLAGFGLSDDESRPLKWQFPSVSIQPGGFALVFASGQDGSLTGQDLHANFRLNASGERLFLNAPDGRTVDEVDLPPLGPDQSAGRWPNGAGSWQLYSKTQATPAAPNFEISLGTVIDSPRFSPEQRFFPAGAAVKVELAAATGQTIRYTTDGSPVSIVSPAYPGPIDILRTTVVRAKVFDGENSSVEVARTFFVGAEHGLPVISLAAPPGNFEFRNGYLYGMGSAVISSGGQVLQNFPFSGSNAWKDREVEVSLEFYEPDHRLGFQLHAGLKIYGAWGSRGYPQKSFALFAREKYGEGKIQYRVFPDKKIDTFETLVLRNSGNDNQSTHQTPPRPPITAFGTAPSYGSYFVNGSFTLLRDAMEQRLIHDIGLDTQAYRPAVVYINGDYWGIYNIREKINEAYVVENHGIEKGNIDLIEGYGDVRAGNGTVYNAMRNFIATRDLRDPANYAMVEGAYLDIANFIDYHLAVIYFQNFDIGNIKSWRERVPNGRFRWIVYDQDYGFNLWKPEIYLPAMARDYGDYDNMFDFYTAAAGSGTGWPNEGGRTLLLRRLLLNPSFKERFITRCADLLNGPFREDVVAATIREMAAVIRPEIPRHLERWSWAQLQQRGFGRPHQPEYESFTPATWEKNLEVLLDFARKRPAKLRQDCIAHFALREGLGEVTAEVDPPNSGRLRLNSLALSDLPWSGTFFRDYPLTATAIPKPGYRFAGWTGAGTSGGQPRIELRLNGPATALTARFEPYTADVPASPAVVISEIQYHPAANQDSGDWLELHNRGNVPVNLAGWILRDDNDDHDFLLPELMLEAGAYVVICENAAKFNRTYPGVINHVGDFGFGLGNGGDTIRLFDPTGELTLSLPYDDDPPWSSQADGTGYTLQLIDPQSYSADPAAWKTSTDYGGSPGRP